MAPTKQLDINIEVDVLTTGSTAEVVIAILEFLLYQRNQIPFVYKTYKYYVENVDMTKRSSETNNILLNLQLQRQVEQAKSTKDAISAMRELIYKSFDKNAIKCLRFLFGSTTFTPKEAYTIHIPIESISQKHCHVHHRIPNAHLNQALLSILTSEELYAIFSNNLCPTNLYLELEMLQDSVSSKIYSSDSNTASCIDTNIFPKELCQLPPSCKDIHLHLLHRRPMQLEANALQCCQELKIYDDFMHLNISNKHENGQDGIADKSQIETATALTTNTAPAWWEADIIVRGFKEKPIRGVSIWGN